MRQPHSHPPDDARRRTQDGRVVRRWRRCCARARLLGRTHGPGCGQAASDGAASRALDAVIRRWEHEVVDVGPALEARLGRIIRRLLRRSGVLSLTDLAAVLGMPPGTLKPLVDAQIAIGALARAGAIAVRPNRRRMLVRLPR